MKIRPALLLILLLLVTGWYGCTFNNVDDPKVVANIEDEFSIRLWETLSPTGRSLQLQTETLAEEDCLNYEITYQVLRLNNRIRTSINDIIEPDDCLVGKSRPTAKIDLGEVDNGLYEFEVNLNNSTIINTGQMVVNDESYTVEMNSTNGITLVPWQLLRVPEQTVWGYLSADAVDNIASEFMEELNSAATAREFLAGDYGYFTVNDNNVDLPIDTEFTEKYAFLINYTGELSELEALVDRYNVKYGSNLEMKVYTWRGEVF